MGQLINIILQKINTPKKLGGGGKRVTEKYLTAYFSGHRIQTSQFYTKKSFNFFEVRNRFYSKFPNSF